MIRELIQHRISQAIARLQERQDLPTGLPTTGIEIADPKDPTHGDYACNFALIAAKPAGMNPRELAEKLREELLAEEEELAKAPLPPAPEGEGAGGWGFRLFSAIEVAGPGFLNIRIGDQAWLAAADWANKRADRLPNPQSPVPGAQRLNVEFVSVNPNGPITVGSGRGAAFGSTLCNVLEAAGHEVHREYYINDGLNSEQMRLFGESVYALALESVRKSHGTTRDEAFRFPQGGYRGDYVQELADWILDYSPSQMAWEGLEYFVKEAKESMIHTQRSALDQFGVVFNTWFSEQSLHDSGKVESSIKELEAKGAADDQPIRRVLKLAKGGKIEDVEIVEQPNEEVDEDLHTEPAPGIEHQASGPEPSAQSPTPDVPQSSIVNRQSSIGNTLWLRSTKFGDDMDRVLRRKDGRLTYIASDVAYHKDKFSRPVNADKLITILGPDHHGYIARLHAVVAALLEKAEQTDQSDLPLTEIEQKLYASPEERDACLAALEESKKRLEVIIFQIVRFVKEWDPLESTCRHASLSIL